MVRISAKKRNSPFQGVRQVIVLILLILGATAIWVWWSALSHAAKEMIHPDDLTSVQKVVGDDDDWCQQVAAARARLKDPKLHVSYPCKGKRRATSAIVCMLTGGVAEEKKSRTVFSGRDYINGAMALGASIRQHVDMSDTHQLLLIREDFVLAPEDAGRLEAVGWTLGTTPTFQILPKYTPRFPRCEYLSFPPVQNSYGVYLYIRTILTHSLLISLTISDKTTYTKLTVIGLSEYKCAMLMDADTLVVGPLDGILDCKVFDKPEYQVAGTLDYYHRSWFHFNTGSLLWRTSAEEMMRVQKLTQDPSFMKRFESDQIFLNNVYPDRTDKKKNQDILDGKSRKEDWGAVVPLSWDYNAQTHVEVQLPDFWLEHRSTVKIIHFTEKKGWQCEERHEPPPPFSNENPKRCDVKSPLCFCREAYLWWDALRRAEKMSNKS